MVLSGICMDRVTLPFSFNLVFYILKIAELGIYDFQLGKNSF